MQKSPVCSRCCGIYIVKEGARHHKRPLLLKCGHTFCESCLLHLLKEKKTCIVCPTCQVETQMPNGEAAGVKSLPVDKFTVGDTIYTQGARLEQELGLLTPAGLRMVSRKKTVTGGATSCEFVHESDKMCHECNKKPAVQQCTKCQTNLCGPCFPKVHNFSNSLRNHVPSPLVEDSLLEISPVCKIHDSRPIEYYCEDDGTNICSRCVIVGEHKGHNISSIEDKNREVINDLEPNLRLANHVHRRLKNIDQQLDQYIPDMTEQLLPTLTTVRSHFKHLHGLLQVREETLIQNAVELYQAGCNPIDTLKEELKREYKQLDIAIKSAHRIINNNDEVIVNAKEVLEKLMHAKDIPCHLDRKEEATDTERIMFTTGDPIDDAINLHGSVTGTVPQRFVMYSMQDKPEVLCEDQESVISSPISTPTTTPINTPLDGRSVASTTSEDVIIEDVEEIVLSDGNSVVSQPSSSASARKSNRKHKTPVKSRFRGQHEKVTLTHFHNPSLFVVQRRVDHAKLSTLSYSMQQWCRAAGAGKHMVTAVDVGDVVLAIYSGDQQWYRARVRAVMSPEDEAGAGGGEQEPQQQKTMVEVVYIDYGNSEVLPLDRLRHMQPRFMKHPEFAIECGLFNIVPTDRSGTWSQEAINAFVVMVKDKIMLLSVVREENNIQIVDLCKPPEDDIEDDRPMSVRDALVFLELANLESPASVPISGGAPAPKRNYLRPEPMEEGQRYQVVVSYAGTPDTFYAQELGEEGQYLANMMAQIQDTYNKKKRGTLQIISPQLGMICVAKFSGDHLWYRARVLDLPGNQNVLVQYVDYGNMENVKIKDMRKIIDTFLVLPAQAICCNLMDIEAQDPSGNWTQECLHWWSEFATMKMFSMKIIHADSRKFHVVLKGIDMTTGNPDQEQPVNMAIVGRGLARSTGKWSSAEEQVKTEMSYHVPRLSYQVGEGSYPEPCDMDHPPAYWKSRVQRPTRKYQETQLTPPDSPVRESKSNDVPDPTIPGAPTFVRRSPRKSPSQPEAAGQQGASSPVPKGASPMTTGVARQLLQSTGQGQSSERAVSPRMSPKAPNTQMSPSRRERSDPNVTNSNKPAAEGGKSAESGSVKNASDVQVVVSEFISPSQFHIQLTTGQDKLKQMMVELNEQYRNSEMGWVSWIKGAYCVALSARDGVWYRAKISKILQKNLMEVFMLDYGFTEIVTTANLRKVLRQYRNLRCFSIPCHLVDLTPAGGMKEWSKTACEFMRDEIKNKVLYISKKGNVIDGTLPIDLLTEEYIEESALEPGHKVFKSMVSLMKEKGLAIPVRRKVTEVSKETKVYPVLYYKKAEADVKDGDKVMPVYVDYDGVIHCYTMEGDDEFQSMCDTLHQKFRDSDAHGGEQQWVKGQACAAFYPKDGQWHRASVVVVEPDKIQVHFIDYGNSEWMDHDMLRADIEEFIDQPQQTFLCILHDTRPRSADGKWDAATLEFMHKELVNKYCNITVIDKNGYESEHMSVNLELNGQDVGSMLVQCGLVQRGEYITDQELQSQQIFNVLQKQCPFKKSTLGRVGTVTPVTVQHVELPNLVYLQHVRAEITEDLTDEQKRTALIRSEMLSKLEQLSIDLNQVAPTLPVIPTPKIGLPCCAQFGLDMCWYRALIVEVYKETKQILILFVDYGNSEIITINQMRALPPQFLSLPSQAIRCTLSDVDPPSVSWTKNALREVMVTLANKLLLAKIVSNNPLSVEIYEKEEDVNTNAFVYQSVIDAGHLKYTPPPVSPDTPTPMSPQILTPASPRVNPVTKEAPSATQEVVHEEATPETRTVENQQVATPETPTVEETVTDTAADADTTSDSQAEAACTDSNQNSTNSGVGESKSWVDMAASDGPVNIATLPSFEDNEVKKDSPRYRGRSRGGGRSSRSGGDVSLGSGDRSRVNENGSRSRVGGSRSSVDGSVCSESGACDMEGSDGASSACSSPVKTKRRSRQPPPESVVHDDECFN